VSRISLPLRIAGPWRIAAALVTAALASPAFADPASAEISVGIRVQPSVELDVLEQPAAITVTRADVALGYKDIPVRYRVRHNDRRGYRLRIEPYTGFARRMELRGLDGTRDVPPQGIELQRQGAPFEQELVFEFRLLLDASSVAGTYEWPLRVAAATL
jgi:hypothetical protein